MHADPHGPETGASSDPNDRVAREAARRFVTGRARDEHAAIDDARMHLKLPGATPSLLLVRRHVEAMEQQAMGAGPWQAARIARLSALEELITLLEEHALGDRVLVVGRAARGHLTGAAPVRLRVYTDRPIREVAAALELGGIEDLAFETDDTARGRFDAVRFVDEEAGEIMLVRLPADQWRDRDRNLYRDEPVPILDLAGLRRLIAAGEPQSAAENAAASSSAKEG